MRAYARLLRPANALIAAAAVCVGAVVTVGTSEAALQWQAVALGAVVAFLFTGAGNALNDVYDRETDRVNHPDRPIPSGQVSPRAASVLAGSLFAAAILAGMSINIPASGLVLASLALMVAYEERFKASGWSGNL
ncbi:MAG TPA: UbiA family prenyltransferase, partial [Thermoplasmata archaeon]|nr:UbiA family prenyltransferase [Thermoplasmata archaeon]